MNLKIHDKLKYQTIVNRVFYQAPNIRIDLQYKVIYTYTKGVYYFWNKFIDKTNLVKQLEQFNIF